MFFVFKQKTAYDMRISDWSSDVCSSDLRRQMDQQRMIGKRGRRPIGVTSLSFVCIATLIGMPAFAQDARSNVDQIGSSRSPGAKVVQQLSHRPPEVQGSAAPEIDRASGREKVGQTV